MQIAFLIILAGIIRCGGTTERNLGNISSQENSVPSEKSNFSLVGGIDSGGKLSLGIISVNSFAGTATRIGERHFITAQHVISNPSVFQYQGGSTGALGRISGSFPTVPHATGILLGTDDIHMATLKKVSIGTKENVGVTLNKDTIGIARVGTIDSEPQGGEEFSFYGYGCDIEDSLRFDGSLFNPWKNFGVSRIGGRVNGGRLDALTSDYSLSINNAGIPTNKALLSRMLLKIAFPAPIKWGAKSFDVIYSSTKKLICEGDSGGGLFDLSGNMVGIASVNAMVLSGSFPDYSYWTTSIFERISTATSQQITERLEIPIIDHFKKDTSDQYKLDALALRPGDTFEIQGYDLDGGTLKFNDRDIIGMPALSGGSPTDPSTPRTQKFTVAIPPNIDPALLNVELAIKVEKDSTVTLGKKLTSEPSDRKLKIVIPELKALARVKNGDMASAMNALVASTGSPSPVGNINVVRGEDSVLVLGKYTFLGSSKKVSPQMSSTNSVTVSQVSAGIPQSLIDQGYEVWQFDIPNAFPLGLDSKIDVVGSSPLLTSTQVVRVVGPQDWEMSVYYERINQGEEHKYSDGSSIACPSYSNPQDFGVVEIQRLENLSQGGISTKPSSLSVEQVNVKVPVSGDSEEFIIGSNEMTYNYSSRHSSPPPVQWYYVEEFSKLYKYNLFISQREQQSGGCVVDSIEDSTFSGSGRKMFAFVGVDWQFWTASTFLGAPSNLSSNSSIFQAICTDEPQRNSALPRVHEFHSSTPKWGCSNYNCYGSYTAMPTTLLY